MNDAPEQLTVPAAADGEAASEYRRSLRRATIESERLRTRALAAVAAIMLAAVNLALLLSPVFRERLPPAIPLAVLVPFIAFEAAVAAILRRRLAADRDLPVVARYLNVLVETSLPSVILLVQLRVVGPQEALGFDAPLLYFLFIVLSTLRLDFRLSLFTGAVAAVELFAVAALFAGPTGMQSGLTLTPIADAMRSLVLLLGGVLAGWVALRLRRQLHGTLAAVAARDRVTSLFGQHVSPQVVDRLLNTGAGNLSEIRRVAVMFVDIRGFTEASRKRQPERVVARLDALFSVLVAVVDRHGGIVNKFLGDGFLALYGAPLPEPQAALKAVTAGRDMLAAVAGHNKEHQDWPVEIGIAVHVGEVVTGTVGAPNRKEFTVIGDTVNIAARIEALNKEFATRFLVSEAVHRELGESGDAAVPLGPVAIRGYDDPVELWQVA